MRNRLREFLIAASRQSRSEMRIIMKRYDVIIVGAGPGGIFSAYELTKKDSDLKIAVFET